MPTSILDDIIKVSIIVAFILFIIARFQKKTVKELLGNISEWIRNLDGKKDGG